MDVLALKSVLNKKAIEKKHLPQAIHSNSSKKRVNMSRPSVQEFRMTLQTRAKGYRSIQPLTVVSPHRNLITKEMRTMFASF